MPANGIIPTDVQANKYALLQTPLQAHTHAHAHTHAQARNLCCSTYTNSVTFSTLGYLHSLVLEAKARQCHSTWVFRKQ